MAFLWDSVPFVLVGCHWTALAPRAAELSRPPLPGGVQGSSRWNRGGYLVGEDRVPEGGEVTPEVGESDGPPGRLPAKPRLPLEPGWLDPADEEDSDETCRVLARGKLRFDLQPDGRQ